MQGRDDDQAFRRKEAVTLRRTLRLASPHVWKKRRRREDGKGRDSEEDSVRKMLRGGDGSKGGGEAMERLGQG